MKSEWTIPIRSDGADRVALTFGDPANALQPADKYALQPLPEAIANWNTIIPLLKQDHEYDITAFYSKRKTNLTKDAEQALFEANQGAFDAAKKKDGLILYFQGVLLSNANETISPDLHLSFVPNCMSFCIWNTLQEAKAGAKITEHKEAARQLSKWYDAFAIEKFQLTKKAKTIVFKKTNYVTLS